MNTNEIKRYGTKIRFGNGITATEGYEGSLPTLTFRKNGKCVAFLRGSSLQFSDELTDEDKDYLLHLAVSSLTELSGK